MCHAIVIRRLIDGSTDRLIDIRHNYYSHRNARDVVADVVIAEAYPHMRDEVGEFYSQTD